MSAPEQFRQDAHDLIAQLGGGLTVTVTDEQADDTLATGNQTVDPRSFTALCTPPTPFTEAMIDGERTLAGDANIFLERGDPAITFDPRLGMLALVDGRQYTVQGHRLHAGSIEIHLRDGSVTP